MIIIRYEERNAGQTILGLIKLLLLITHQIIS